MQQTVCYPHALQKAILYLRDAGLFTAHDAPFLTAIADRLEAGKLVSDKQRDVATRMLGKYADDLRAAGIDWDGGGGAEEIRTAVRAPDAAHAEVVRLGGEYKIAVRTPFALKDVCKSVPGARWTSIPAATRRLDLPGHSDGGPEHPRRVRPVRPGHRRRRRPTARAGRRVDQGPGPQDLHRPAGRARRGDAVLAAPAADLLVGKGTGRRAARAGHGSRQDQGAIDLIRTTADVKQVLVLCPKKVLGVWPKQVDLHAPGIFHVENGMRAKRSGEMAALSVTERTAAYDKLLGCRCGKIHMVIANYEITAHDPFRTWGLKQQWDFTVLDEGHRVRAPQGVWSKWVREGP